MIPPENHKDVAIIVLGAAVWKDGRASPTLERRCAHAASIFNPEKHAFIVTTGGIGKNPPAEARVAKFLLVQASIPEHRVHAEPHSRTTFENIKFSAPILHEHGIDNIIIVTDRFHGPRSWLVGKYFGFSTALSHPNQCKIPNQFPSIFMSYLREVPAIVYYAFKLTIAHFHSRK